MSETLDTITPNPLRALREQAGMHLAALAVTLKVAPQKLEALEAGRYDELPNLTFARALATSVCRVLKVDPVPVLACLPQAQSVHIRESAEGINTPFPPRGGGATGKVLGPVSQGMPRPVLLAAVVLVLAGGLWWWLPQQSGLTEIETPAEPVAVLETAPEPVEAPTAEMAPPPQVPAPAATEAATPVAPIASVSQELAVPAPSVSPAAVPAIAPTPEVKPAAPVAADALRLRARQSSWVQVTGASGRLLLQRTLQTGEEIAFSNDLPLAVVVGRADATEVLVRGNAFDLTPYVRDRVARFEVR